METTLPVAAYFKQPATRTFLTEAWLHHAHLGLPGVFDDGRRFSEIDAPLWTLPVEWTMYVVVLLLCTFVHRRTLLKQARRRTALVLLLAGVLTVQMLPLQWVFAWPWMVAFCLGSAAYVWRRRIMLQPGLAFATLVIYGLLMHVGIRHLSIFFIPVLGYFLLTVAYHPALHLHRFHAVGDYSYGLYIYAFPIQQVLLTRYTRPLLLFAVSYPVSLGAAALSWHFVESRCLRLKDKLRRSENSRVAQNPGHTVFVENGAQIH